MFLLNSLLQKMGKSDTKCSYIRILYILILILGIYNFWLLRYYYWNITDEPIFSDMSGFEGVARNILKNVDFSWNDFWRTYNPPTLALLRALQITILGDSISMWQLFQTLISFTGLLWLMYEIMKITQRPWLALLLLWTVSLSKSSIFWSLKLARESMSEAFIYYSIAISLSALRNKKPLLFFLTGFIYMITVFNRTNFILILPIFIFSFLIYEVYYNRKMCNKKILFLCMYYLLGISIVWFPWIIRSYNLYWHIMLLTTQGPYSFLWELGDIKIKDETGKEVTKNCNILQNEAPEQFPNDYEASIYANKFVKQWLKNNWRKYPGIIIMRLCRTINDRTIYLTKVSRTELYPDILNYFLIDKKPLLIIFGLAGLTILAIKFSYLYIFLFISISSWMTACLFLGYPRMLEPVIPVFLFGNFAWFLLLDELSFIKKFRSTFLIIFSLSSIVITGITFIAITGTFNKDDDFLKNAIKNGGYQEWSKGSNFINPASNDFIADNWFVNKEEGNGRTPSINIKRSTTIPPASKSPFSCEVEVTDKGKEDNTTSYCIVQSIDDFKRFKDKTISCSLWIKAPADSTIGIDLVDGIKHNITVLNVTYQWKLYKFEGININDITYLKFIIWFSYNKHFGFPENKNPVTGSYFITQVQLNKGEEALPYEK